MGIEGAPGTCQEPTSFYLLGVALWSFCAVLATHLLAGEVDTTLACAPLTRRLSWWCRYYNPLNLSWRYYSMVAYRCIAHGPWGTRQLALINHEEHPFLPPLPYIVGETVDTLHVRRLEMAGLLTFQGILTFSAAYQGFLAIQYAISTEGIPYLPNMTVPLAMVGLFRVMASKWVATKIQVDAYPYPCEPVSPASQSVEAHPHLHPFAQKTDPSRMSLHTINSSSDPSSVNLPIIKSSKSLSSFPFSISESLSQPCALLAGPPITAFNIAPSPSLPPNSSGSTGKSCMLSPISVQFSQPPVLLLPSDPHKYCPTSPSLHLPLSPQFHKSPALPMLSRPYSVLISTPQQAAGFLPSASNEHVGRAQLMPLVSFQTHAALLPRSHLLPSSLLSLDASKGSTHTVLSSSLLASTQNSPPREYKSNKLVVAGWIGVLFGLVIMSFLPYKVAAAYKLPHRLLQFSMQIFYQYIAISELFFHAHLLFKGPRALANRVLFFDHWTFKAQTVGFYCLLILMLVVSLIDFVKNGYYRDCA